MPDHDPALFNSLDSEGEKRWGFSFRYIYPDSPEDGRDWFNAIATVEEVLLEHGQHAWPNKDTIVLSINETDVYSRAYEKAAARANAALSLGGLSLSELIEITYHDPDNLPDYGEPPF